MSWWSDSLQYHYSIVATTTDYHLNLDNRPVSRHGEVHILHPILFGDVNEPQSVILVQGPAIVTSFDQRHGLCVLGSRGAMT
jgi:hypothetical protein